MSVIAHRKLTQKQQRFLTEYLKDMDAVQAALRAGYSQTNAEVMARQNLKNPEIQCAIRAALSGQSQIVTKDNVLREFARIAFVDPRKLFRSDGSPKPIEELDADTAAALA
ncbi:MAG: terminase small subunit [Butyricicoccus sp.]